MNDDASNTRQRDSLFPVAMTSQEATPSEPLTHQRGRFVDLLVVAYAVGLAFALATVNDAATPRQKATHAISHARAHSLPSDSTFVQPKSAGKDEALEGAENKPENPEPIMPPRDDSDKRNKVKKPRLPVQPPAMPPSEPGSPKIRDPRLAPPNEGRKQPAEQFNEFEAMVAIDKTARGASVCLSSSDPRPVMRVAVTFNNSGRVKKSGVESGPYQNTSQGECIARVLRAASIKPFDGSAVTVHRMIQIR